MLQSRLGGEQNCRLGGRTDRGKVECRLFVALRVQLSPKLEQQRRHESNDNEGAVDLRMARGAQRDHQVQDGLPWYTMVNDDGPLVTAGGVANAAAVAIAFQDFLL